MSPRSGDLVLAREEYGSQIKRQRVEETFARVSDHLRVLEFRDAVGSNQTIKTTDEHPIWSHDQAKYILANALAVGANVIGPNGELQTLVDSRREEFTQGTPVYNFRVSEYQTYYVAQNIDGTPLLVHNARCGAGANSTNNGSLKAKSGDLEEAARKAREFNPKPGKSVAANTNVPQKATNTLGTIRQTNAAPKGYKGGGVFANDGRQAGQVLPKLDSAGNPITYREFDVNPFQKGVNRGPARIVMGSDGKAYFTNDHYKTFIEIP